MQNMWKTMHARGFWQIENLSRFYRASREHNKLAQWINLAVEKLLRSNLEILIEETYVELLSRCCRECIEQLSRRQKQGFPREEKHTRWMQQGSYSNKHPSSMLSTQTQLKSRCKVFLNQKHTLNKPNQFYIFKTSQDSLVSIYQYMYSLWWPNHIVPAHVSKVAKNLRVLHETKQECKSVSYY